MPSRAAALLALALLLAPAAHGQTAYLVRDIAQGEALIPSLPAFVDSLTAVGRKVFFLGRTTANDLWVGASDGTSGGTQLLAPIRLFSTLSFQVLGGPHGRVLWVEEDGLGDGVVHLWSSDGTRAGTYLLTGAAPALEIRGGGAVLAGRFYFFGCTDADGCSLWATDGTQAGTAAVAPLTLPRFSEPAFAAAGHTVYLATDSELWASDGTAAGTRRVATFPPLALSQLTAAAGRVFFAVDYHDLWTSDGAAAGTLRVGHTSGSIGPIQAFGDHVDVPVSLGSVGYAQLWRSDGTPAGTVEIAPSFFISLSTSYVPYDVAEVGGRTLYYGIDASYHSYLFSTDAARGSTVVLKKDVGSLANRGVVRAGGRAVFTVDTATTQEVWTTDGTAAGTRRLLDPCAGAPCSVREPRPLGDGAFFVSHPVAASGQSVQCTLWRSDGTSPGTVRFASFPCPAFFSGQSAAATLGGEVLFPAGEVNALWISDGTAAGTHPLSAHLDASAQPRQLLGSGDMVFFVTGPATDPELWSSAGAEASTARLAAASDLAFDNLPLMARAAHGLVASLDRRRLLASDGTPGGTSEIADFGASRIAGLAALGGEAFFPVKTGDRNQLWKSDGTAAGTVEVGDLPANVVQPDYWTAVGSTIYFLDDPPGFEPALWATDGTLAGTRRLYTFAGDLVPPQFTRAGSTVYFVADDRLHGGTQVWKTDGTPQGTTLVHAIDGPYDGSQPRDLVELAGNLYFFANMGTFEDERLGLFRSDGTDAGTVLVKEFVEDTGGTFSSRPIALGGTLFFVANDGVHGRELWKSDGTAGGTALVRDISPGEASSQPALPALVAGGRLYLAADDGAHGLELWESDGTEAGTRLAQDIASGAPASSPGELTAAGDRLYFAADDGAHGRELWALPLAASGCQPAADHLCLAGGRFRVDADWRDFQGHAGRGTAVGLTGDTGYFWFFSPSNVEVVAKVLDGRGVNQAFWVFYGALSSVEYTLTVTDTETGLTRRYFNPSGVLASVGDTDGFGPLGASSTYRPPQRPQTPSPLALVSGRSDPRAATGRCDAAPGRLCLQGGRFAVTAGWKDFQGHAGSGTAVALTGDTGYFWFFDPGNVEVVTKVLDGRTLNGKFWLFYGALSSVEYALTVTDTQTGTVKMYKNASGHLASVADTSAF